jgi:hypothetical protein
MKGLVAGIIVVMLAYYVIDEYQHSRHAPGVLVSSEPYQRLIGGGRSWQQGNQKFTPLADFHLQARVLSTESYWMDHGSEISPLDLAVGWGPMSDQAVLDEISISQGQRWYRFWPKHQKMPVSNDEILFHSANIHTIPATPQIKKQLRALRNGDIVEMDGSLVEVQWPDGGTWTSSLSRTDLGNGACELMWVRSVAVREVR